MSIKRRQESIPYPAGNDDFLTIQDLLMRQEICSQAPNWFLDDTAPLTRRDVVGGAASLRGLPIRDEA